MVSPVHGRAWRTVAVRDESESLKAEIGKLEPQAQRLFIAISLPEVIKDEIETAQGELRRALPGDDLRWTKREQFHLTLKFLGNVSVNRTEALIRSVQEACENHPAMRLCAGRIGFFPHLRSPRVIWAWVHDREDLLPKLQSAIELAVRDFTTGAAEEKFTGHVTLGRAKNIGRPQAEILAKLAGGMSERFFGEWTASKIEIIRSQLSSDGARYATLAVVALAGTSH
jgi:2'-5' RNA ligase